MVFDRDRVGGDLKSVSSARFGMVFCGALGKDENKVVPFIGRFSQDGGEEKQEEEDHNHREHECSYVKAYKRAGKRRKGLVRRVLQVEREKRNKKIEH